MTMAFESLQVDDANIHHAETRLSGLNSTTTKLRHTHTDRNTAPASLKECLINTQLCGFKEHYEASHMNIHNSYFVSVSNVPCGDLATYHVCQVTDLANGPPRSYVTRAV
jgi:hypothetical protein